MQALLLKFFLQSLVKSLVDLQTYIECEDDEFDINFMHLAEELYTQRQWLERILAANE